MGIRVDNPNDIGSSPISPIIRGIKMIKVIENKNIEKSKVNHLENGDIVLSVKTKKTYKQYLKEISKLKF